MNLKIRKMLITCIVAVLICGVAIVSNNINNEEKITKTSSTTVSTKKIEWGIQRANNHEQPNLGKVNKEIIAFMQEGKRFEKEHIRLPKNMMK